MTMKKLILTLSLSALALTAQTRFEVDPSWPKPLPEKWINGQLGGICTDSHDHIVVVDRRNITKEEELIAQAAPPILMFDSAGNLVRSWGDPNVVPNSIHGCAFDKENNVWVAGNEDGILQKYTHDGKLLMQIGKRGVVDSADGTGKGAPKNSSQEGFYHPAGLVVDPANGDLYIADGYGNRRVAVFDKNGKFLRQWGHQATDAESQSGAGGAFIRIVHCIAMGNDGLIYVCDRQGDRVQVFDKMGNFKRNIWIKTGSPTLPDPNGTAWWVAFSRDPQQKYMYVMNGRNEQVHILDHTTGEILGSFGRPGHQVGEMIHGHTMTIDSKGNIYVAETDWGRRVQRFKPVEGRATSGSQ